MIRDKRWDGLMSKLVGFWHSKSPPFCLVPQFMISQLIFHYFSFSFYVLSGWCCEVAAKIMACWRTVNGCGNLTGMNYSCDTLTQSQMWKLLRTYSSWGKDRQHKGDHWGKREGEPYDSRNRPLNQLPHSKCRNRQILRDARTVCNKKRRRIVH